MAISRALLQCALWNYRGQRTVQDGASVLGERLRAQRTSPLRISRVSYQRDIRNAKADQKLVDCTP